MLEQAVSVLQKNEHPIIHTDRGPLSMARMDKEMEKHHLTRTLSKKGCSSDHAACEGFFGRIKSEFFYEESWINVSH